MASGSLLRAVRGIRELGQFGQCRIQVLLGRSVLPMEQLLRMGRGAVIPLDAKTSD
jgi:hypothetical protein